MEAQLLDKYKKRAALNAFDLTDSSSIACLRELIALYLRNQLFFADTLDAVPKVDQKFRHGLLDVDPSNSYNKTYCQRYFSNSDVMKSYQLYLSLVFASHDPASLCRKFGVWCCPGARCLSSSQCLEQWSILEHLLRSAEFLFK